MKHLVLTIFTFFLLFQIGLAQNIQKHANSLFPSAKFLSFIGSVDYGEEILLKWDFRFTGSSTSYSNEAKYNDYRLDHSFNTLTNKFHFDFYSITDDGEAFIYKTSSNKNFLTYKKRMQSLGFKKIEPDIYQLLINSSKYVMNISRSVHESGTPNYQIFLAKYE